MVSTSTPIDWDAAFRPGDNLRVTRRISKASCPRAMRHLDGLPAARREQLEREWQEHAVDPRPHRDSIEDEIKARAAKEWADFD